jgi:hypothetical protein
MRLEKIRLDKLLLNPAQNISHLISIQAQIINRVVDFLPCIRLLYADYGGLEVQRMNCFRSLESWDRGFESHSMYGYLYAFILRLCRPV